jgi:hypothetical protein
MHHINPRSMGGGKDGDLLNALHNLAPACQKHHQMLGHQRLIWMKAMVKSGLATSEDYKNAKLGRIPIYPEWSDEAYPPLMECYGNFGYGNTFWRDCHTDPTRIPAQLSLVFTQVSTASHFCYTACPFSRQCLAKKREALLEQARGH